MKRNTRIYCLLVLVTIIVTILCWLNYEAKSNKSQIATPILTPIEQVDFKLRKATEIEEKKPAEALVLYEEAQAILKPITKSILWDIPNVSDVAFEYDPKSNKIPNFNLLEDASYLVQSKQNKLLAINNASGNILWRVDRPGGYPQIFFKTPNNLYYASSNTLLIIDPVTGETSKTFRLAERPSGFKYGGKNK